MFANLPARLARLEIRYGFFGARACRGLFSNTGLCASLEQLEFTNSQPSNVRLRVDDEARAIADAALEKAAKEHDGHPALAESDLKSSCGP